jgi:hypothetical protein
MVSPLLAIPEMAASQANKYLTVNNVITALEGAVTGIYVDASVTTSSNAITLTEAQFLQHTAFKFSGASANFTVTTQGENSQTTPTERLFTVWNADTTYTCTVKSDAAGDTVVIQPGGKTIMLQIGDDVTAVAEAVTVPTTAVTPYDIAFFKAGTCTSSEVIAHIEVARSCTIPDDFTGSQAYAGTNPSDGDWIFDIAKNGSNIGTLTISTGGVMTFATTGMSAETFSAGDRISVTAPATVDSTGADLGITLAATTDVTLT